MTKINISEEDRKKLREAKERVVKAAENLLELSQFVDHDSMWDGRLGPDPEVELKSATWDLKEIKKKIKKKSK